MSANRTLSHLNMVYEFKSPCYGTAEITLIHDFPWTLADVSTDMGSGADDCGNI